MVSILKRHLSAISIFFSFFFWRLLCLLLFFTHLFVFVFLLSFCVLNRSNRCCFFFFCSLRYVCCVFSCLLLFTEISFVSSYTSSFFLFFTLLLRCQFLFLSLAALFCFAFGILLENLHKKLRTNARTHTQAHTLTHSHMQCSQWNFFFFDFTSILVFPLFCQFTLNSKHKKFLTTLFALD